jgi:hypothetical protein
LSYRDGVEQWLQALGVFKAFCNLIKPQKWGKKKLVYGLICYSMYLWTLRWAVSSSATSAFLNYKYSSSSETYSCYSDFGWPKSFTKLISRLHWVWNLAPGCMGPN